MTLDINELPDDLTIKQLRETLRAVGYLLPFIELIKEEELRTESDEEENIDLEKIDF